ncbi:MAG: hypothetical protein Q9220_002199 [cf. Caloplaca sp. 1 TL-2023]
MVAETSSSNNEARILDLLSNGPAKNPGKAHVVQLQDNFRHHGPNGTHECLVLELLGPNVPSEVECYQDYRLPASIAWEACKQTAQALDYVHANDIVHGDLHPGNIVFGLPSTAYETENAVMAALGKPEVGDISGYAVSSRLPNYLVASASFPIPLLDTGGPILKVIDFGGAHLPGDKPLVRCPLIFRPPEALFDGEWGVKADVWTLGCTVSQSQGQSIPPHGTATDIFELTVGYPPFNAIIPNRDSLIREWVAMFGPLPTRWAHYSPTTELGSQEISQISLPDWLHETYFEEGKTPGFAEAHIEMIGELLDSMMKYCPSDRPRVSHLLKHAWFEKNPFQIANTTGALKNT